jgi:hypothetical protein
MHIFEAQIGSASQLKGDPEKDENPQPQPAVNIKLLI